MKVAKVRIPSVEKNKCHTKFADPITVFVVYIVTILPQVGQAHCGSGGGVTPVLLFSSL